VRFYREVIERRMAKELFLPEVLEHAIESTGKLSELVVVVRAACMKAISSRGQEISESHLNKALEDLMYTYDRTITKAHREKLIEIYITKEARDEDPNFSITRDLLFSLTAVEYTDENGRWCEVNPLLRPLVKKWISS
jgi:hypothetical protein